jgi:hypothetical protein
MGKIGLRIWGGESVWDFGMLALVIENKTRLRERDYSDDGPAGVYAANGGGRGGRRRTEHGGECG